MSLEEIKNEIINFLKTLGIKEYELLSLGNGVAYQFVIEQFGTIFCIADVNDIGMVATSINDFFFNYRVVYITPSDELNTKQNDMLWELMRSGYMRWLRVVYPNKFRTAIVDQRLGDRILRKRIELYKDEPRYKFLREDDQEALKMSSGYILSIEPGFFDFMPEENIY